MSGPDGELRPNPRYVATPPLPAGFGTMRVAILNISSAGALIAHPDKIKLGTEAPLRFVHAAEGQLVELYAEVVWSRVEFNASGQEFRSGLRFTQWVEVAQSVIERLLRSGLLRLDTSVPANRLRAGATAAPKNDDLLLIRKAREHFQHHPDQIARYSNQARATGTAALNVPYRDEVFAIWEFLQRRVDLELIKKQYERPR
jgi:hypothetical protein